jgi:hypothetical protein
MKKYIILQPKNSFFNVESSEDFINRVVKENPDYDFFQMVYSPAFVYSTGVYYVILKLK